MNDWHSHRPSKWHYRRHRPRHPRFIFWRFAWLVGFLLFWFVVISGIASYLVSRQPGGLSSALGSIGLAGCGLFFLFPILAIGLGMRAFRSIGAPLGEIMDAADSVAEGNLNVQVQEHMPGEFGQLARSFNRMTRELERADQQRRNLTADIAHELRTPLHIIQGNLEGILDGVYEPDPDQISAVLDEVHLLNRLVDDLQTLSQAEAGQLPLEDAPINIADLFEDVITSFTSASESSGIHLETHIEGTPQELEISGDADRLDQVLSNLVANALRHTHAGGTIHLLAAPDPEGVLLQVSDDGEGIPAEDLPYIFDRFWRGDRARTRSPQSGSGLGLAISRQLVQAHGGRISVASQTGKGTTFSIHLPHTPPQAHAPKQSHTIGEDQGEYL